MERRVWEGVLVGGLDGWVVGWFLFPVFFFRPKSRVPPEAWARKRKEKKKKTNPETGAEFQWIVAQRLLSALTILRFN